MILNSRKNATKNVLVYVPVLFFLLLTLIPFYWVLVTALKPEGAILQKPVKYWPSSVTFENFMNAWKNVGFERYFINSFFIAISVALIVLVFALLVAYPLTRFRFRGKKGVMLVLLCSQFLPHAMLLVPLFMIFRSMHLINSPVSLICSYVTFSLPFNAMMMRVFMSSIPVAMEESAMIDGCTRVGAIFRIILPILLPGVVACGSFAFVDSWKEFLFAVMFINDPERMTIPVGLSYMLGEFTINYGTLAAGAIIAIIPPILIFAYIQKYLVKGLSTGAVKG